MKKFLLGLAILATSVTVTFAQESPALTAVQNCCARLENALLQGKITKDIYRKEASALKATIKKGGHEAAIKAVEVKYFGGQSQTTALKGAELQSAENAISVVINRMEALLKAGKISAVDFQNAATALKAAALNGTHVAAISAVESRLFGNK